MLNGVVAPTITTQVTNVVVGLKPRTCTPAIEERIQNSKENTRRYMRVDMSHEVHRLGNAAQCMVRKNIEKMHTYMHGSERNAIPS